MRPGSIVSTSFSVRRDSRREKRPSTGLQPHRQESALCAGFILLPENLTAVANRSVVGSSASDAGGPSIPSKRAVDPRTSAAAGRDGAERGPRRGRQTCGRVLCILGRGDLRATLMDVARRFPQLELRMFEFWRARLVAALRNGVVDIAIISGATRLPETKTMPLWS